MEAGYETMSKRYNVSCVVKSVFPVYSMRIFNLFHTYDTDSSPNGKYPDACKSSGYFHKNYFLPTKRVLYLGKICNRKIMEPGFATMRKRCKVLGIAKSGLPVYS